MFDNAHLRRTSSLWLRCALIAAVGLIIDPSARAEPRLGRNDARPSSVRAWSAHPATARCLERARALVSAHAATFRVMFAALEHPPPDRQETCAAMSTHEPFSAFDGWWVGRWGDMDVAHLWLTIRPGLQLVALADGGVRQRGINLRDEGALCGLVIAPDGTERIHGGRFEPAAKDQPAHLVWRTPTRIYRERVTCADGRRTYEIVETILDRDRVRPGTVARYRPAPAPSR